jgi:surfactin synthase thioesterase subunit
MTKKIKVFCIPFAGGSEYSFFEFKKRCPGALEIVPVALPGRGSRIKEDRIEDAYDLRDDVYRTIKNSITGDYIIYGHSMGGILAALVSEKLKQNGDPMPLSLFISGCDSIANNITNKKRYLLSDPDFIDMLTEMGGSPKEILENRELLDFFLPILRSDFKAIDLYIHDKFEKINLDIDVLIGTADKVSVEEAQDWQKITSGQVTVKQFPGDHFFIYAILDDILKMIENRTLLSTRE